MFREQEVLSSSSINSSSKCVCSSKYGIENVYITFAINCTNVQKKFTGGNERYLCSFLSFLTCVTSYFLPIISKSPAKLATRLRVVIKLYGATLNKKKFCSVTHSEILHKDCLSTILALQIFSKSV